MTIPLNQMTFKPVPERAPSRVTCWEAIVLDSQPRVQSFRLPDGRIQRGMVLTLPCSEPECDHPLQVQIAVDRIVTWPSSWRVTT
jgi:hypothetical protein